MKSSQDVKVINGLFQVASSWPLTEAKRRRRVWLVDDDSEFRELFRRLLDQTDAIKCDREYASGELLLSDLARGVPPETILLDVHLRDRNGIDFIQPIKAFAPQARVLMLTTFFDPQHAARALKAGACGFLVKSASFEEILEQIIAEPVRRNGTAKLPADCESSFGGLQMMKAGRREARSND